MTALRARVGAYLNIPAHLVYISTVEEVDLKAKKKGEEQGEGNPLTTDFAFSLKDVWLSQCLLRLLATVAKLNILYLRGWRSADTHICARFRLSSLIPLGVPLAPKELLYMLSSTG